ncbi:hypothetical protein DKX15_17535, partial [Enterococcus faecium]
MITAATPMIMPSMVSSERILLVAIALQAMRPTSGSLIVSSRSDLALRQMPAVLCDLLDLAVAQLDRPLGVRRDVRIVGDDHDGGALV